MWPFSRKPKPPPPAPIQDAVLGELCYEEEFWNGKVRRGKHELEISIVGDEHGPNQAARQQVVDAIGRLDELLAQAREYLLADLSSGPMKPEDFVYKLTGIWAGAPWQLEQKSFTLTLELEKDEHAIWRVEFGPEGPIDGGRDS